MKTLFFARFKQFLDCSLYYKIFIFSILSLVVIVGTLVSLATHKKTNLATLDAANTKIVTLKLNALQNQLSQFQRTLTNFFAETNFTEITKKINQLLVHAENIKSVDIEQLTQVLTQMLAHTESDLSVQLNSIKQILNTKETPTKYLEVKNLPFELVSIDSIQHRPIASIKYNFDTIPLEKGDVVAGWRLVSLNYSLQRVEFENKSKERVLVITNTAHLNSYNNA